MCSKLAWPSSGWQRVAKAQTSSSVSVGSTSSLSTITFGITPPALLAKTVSPILSHRSLLSSMPVRRRQSRGTVTTSQCSAACSGIQAVVTARPRGAQVVQQLRGTRDAPGGVVLVDRLAGDDDGQDGVVAVADGSDLVDRAAHRSAPPARSRRTRPSVLPPRSRRGAGGLRSGSRRSPAPRATRCGSARCGSAGRIRAPSRPASSTCGRQRHAADEGNRRLDTERQRERASAVPLSAQAFAIMPICCAARRCPTAAGHRRSIIRAIDQLVHEPSGVRATMQPQVLR